MRPQTITLPNFGWLNIKAVRIVVTKFDNEELYNASYLLSLDDTEDAEQELFFSTQIVGGNIKEVIQHCLDIGGFLFDDEVAIYNEVCVFNEGGTEIESVTIDDLFDGESV